MRYLEFFYYFILNFFFIVNITYEYISKTTSNCKYQLLPEFINGVGYGSNELYYSEIRGVSHKPENKIFINVKYESIVTISIEKSFDSDLELSYLSISKINDSFIFHGNLTWGSAGNNTRLFLRSMLYPSQYVISLGSNFHKNKEEIGKIDSSFCSPVSFELGLTTPEIINSQNSLLYNDPFNRVAVTLNVDEKYQYSNKIDDPFIIKTIPQNINAQSKLYNGNIVWSKLFIIPPSKFKEETLLNLYVELGFKYSKSPLQLIIEPIRIDQAKIEFENPQNFKALSRVFFGTPIFNGQLFKETINSKSFRIMILSPWMSNVPKYVLFDLKISISFQTPNNQIVNSFLTNQNECNLPFLPREIVQDGLYSENIQFLKNLTQIPSGHYYFGSKIYIKGSFESLSSKTNHIMKIKITKPSIIYLFSHHDHSDIAITISKKPDLSLEDEDREFYFEYDYYSSSDTNEYERDNKENKISFCNTKNLNKSGITTKEVNFIYCKIDHPDNYYIHLHSFKISESQNSVSLCTPYHLHLEVVPYQIQKQLCKTSTGVNQYQIPINYNLNRNSIVSQSFLLDGSTGVSKLNDKVSLIHTQKLDLRDSNSNYLSIYLSTPEDLPYTLFINVLLHGQIWMSLTHQNFKDFYASSGPITSGIYEIQLFGIALENFLDYNIDCIVFKINILLINLPDVSVSHINSKNIYESNLRKNSIESDYFIKCQMMYMSLPRTIDLTSYSKDKDFIIDGLYLTPLKEYEFNEFNHEDFEFNSILKDAAYVHKMNIYLSVPSTVLISVTNYPGIIIIHEKNSKNKKINSKNLNSFFAELDGGNYEFMFEFDLMEEFLDETIEEGECSLLNFHLSITPINVIPIFPPLIFKDLHKYITGSSKSNFNKKSNWTHTELFSIATEYFKKLFSEIRIFFDRSNLLTLDESNNYTKHITNQGNLFEINEISFWFSPFMNVSIPITIEFEESFFTLQMSIYPFWIPISIKLLQTGTNLTKQNVLKFKTVNYSGNSMEFVYSNIKKGSYLLSIYCINQFTKLTMKKSSLVKFSGKLKPILNTRLFSLRQELLAIPDILPFQELPDSLNRIRFFPTNQETLVSTIMFNFKEIRKTSLKVSKNNTLLLRFLSEPTLISGYEFYISIFKTREGEKLFDNKQIFKSGKYGDTLVLLRNGEYDIYFSPTPNNMPYLLTIGITKFSPFQFENFYKNHFLLSKTSENTLNSYNINTQQLGSNLNELLYSKTKCHYYLEKFKVKLNSENHPYFNSGIINVCQGSIMKSNENLTFTSNIYDVELNVALSSMVFIQTNSDFLYSFYRIGIIVPEGYWVAEQRATQSYLEVELTKGQYILRIEALNSFTSFEEHEIILFSFFVEISPIDGSEIFLDSTNSNDNSLKSTFNNQISQNNDYQCHIPNGVPLPLDLTSIQGGSTVFGGPINMNNPTFIFRSRITLTDIHNGRKKVFLELNKKRFPIYLRLSISPVNFDISNFPNLLEVLFTKIDSNPIYPIYTNSDNIFNSIEKVFKIDHDVLQIEQKGAANIPFWITFTHKFDSMNTRQSCIAFDILLHFVCIEDKELRYLNNAPYSNLAAHWFKAIQTQLDRALNVKKFPSYIHLPPVNNIISMDSENIQTDILIDLEKKSINQALLIVELFYNPLLISSKINLYSDSGEDYNSLTFLKSSTLNFNSNITDPFYVKEKIVSILISQKYILEYYITNLPPYNLKKIPIKMSISIIPIDYVQYKEPLIVSFSPDQSVPILAGQNYHLFIRLSIPLKYKENFNLSKSFYIVGKIDDSFKNQITPYNIQLLDSGYTISVSFNYIELIKTFVEKSDPFSKRGFLVIDTDKLIPAYGNSIYKLAPWISSYVLKKKLVYIEISCYKPNTIGWASITWNGNWDSILSVNRANNQLPKLRNSFFTEKSSTQVIKKPIDVNLTLNNRELNFSKNNINSVFANLYNFKYEGFELFKENNEYNIGSITKTSRKWIYIVVVIVCALIIYTTPIFKAMTLVIKRIYSTFANREHIRRNEYNLIENKNDFDFLSNVASDDEDDDKQDPIKNKQKFTKSVDTNVSYEGAIGIRYSSPNHPKKSN